MTMLMMMDDDDDDDDDDDAKVSVLVKAIPRIPLENCVPMIENPRFS